MKATKIISYVFAVIGTGLLVATFFVTTSTLNFVAKSKVTSGKVVDLVEHTSTDSDNHDSYTYAPVIDFTTADNQDIEFESDVSSNPPAYHAGDSVQVLYDPASPHDAKINSFFELWFASLILGLLGLVFAGIGYGLIIAGIRRAALIKKLLASGQKVEAAVKQVALNTSIKVNGRSPYQIICEYNDGGEVRVFTSDDIWFDPTEYLKEQKISVYVDPANHKKYYVDISFLPKMAR